MGWLITVNKNMWKLQFRDWFLDTEKHWNKGFMLAHDGSCSAFNGVNTAGCDIRTPVRKQANPRRTSERKTNSEVCVCMCVCVCVCVCVFLLTECGWQMIVSFPRLLGSSPLAGFSSSHTEPHLQLLVFAAAIFVVLHSKPESTWRRHVERCLVDSPFWRLHSTWLTQITRLITAG